MIRDYIALTKPRITRLILMSTAVGYYFGNRAGWDWLVLFHTLLGTGLIASGTAALNQWIERDADARMDRTLHRPLPSGRISPRGAFWFAVLLSVLGFFELAFGANLLSGLLGLFTELSYLLIYTPLKKRSWLATSVGAISGAMPPLIGFAGAHGALTPEAWALFAILFVWQFPHFYAIAWMYREDYSRAGMKMLPVVDPSGALTVRQILYYSVALIPISLIPRYLGMSGNLYVAAAIILGLIYFASGVLVARERTRERARHVLLASVLYLPVLYGFMVADHAVR